MKSLPHENIPLRNHSDALGLQNHLH